MTTDDLCTIAPPAPVDGAPWNPEARCPNGASHYVLVNLPPDIGEEITISGERYDRLCDEHTAQAKRSRMFRWARPLT